jgi:anti-anti-sigma regulatory factor
MKPRGYRFDTRVFGGIPVVRCCDSHYHTDCTVPLTDALRDALIKVEASVVVLDMSAVRLFSSSALRVVRAAHVRAVENNGRIVVAGGGELAVNVLKFAPFILHFGTVREALAQFSPDALCAFTKAEG